jgi:hypothetical protein
LTGSGRPGPDWLNVGCGTHLAPHPWWNVDLVENDDTHPDEVVPRGPLPYDDATVKRVMLSHVLEHVPWHEPILRFLADVRRVMAPGAEVLAIGPDVHRTLYRWRDGLEPWHMIESNLEHARCREDLDGPWPEARHQWNCTEARLLLVLEVAGFRDLRPVPVPSAELGNWPVVGAAPWQCAAIAYR